MKMPEDTNKKASEKEPTPPVTSQVPSTNISIPGNSSNTDKKPSKSGLNTIFNIPNLTTPPSGTGTPIPPVKLPAAPENAQEIPGIIPTPPVTSPMSAPETKSETPAENVTPPTINITVTTMPAAISDTEESSPNTAPNTNNQEPAPLMNEPLPSGTPIQTDKIKFNIPKYMYPYLYGTEPNSEGSKQPVMPTEPTPSMPATPQMPTTPTMPQMQPSIQPYGNQYYPSMQSEMNEMPYMGYPAYQGIPNSNLPNPNPYAVPMGIPMFPLYGYDNSADLDKDIEYLKYLYPLSAKTIQKEIDNECDQMEYDGSVMFDEFPDKVQIERIIDRVYAKIKDLHEEPKLETQSLYFYPNKRRENHLHDIVALLLLSEMFHRRRRYRCRKRWY